MQERLFIAKEIPHGYTWTLASRLGEMLTLAQELFGPRDMSYTILGIEFGDSGPFIWYPKSAKNIIVQLSLGSLQSERCALYELAHESIHLLSPSGGPQATFLEEGLATFFSWLYVKRTLDLDYRSRTKILKYRLAGELVEKLLERYPRFFLDARAVEPALWKLDQNLIKSFAPSLSDAQIELLALPFTSDRSDACIKNLESLSH